MQLFEEPVDSIFTLGPAVVAKVEERREPVDVYPAGRPGERTHVGSRTYGVVIYQCKQKAVPVQKGEQWVIPESAIETRFVKVAANGQGGCDVPEQAGRLLGHYRENGTRWWVFLEKLGSESKPSSPGSAAPRGSASGSQPSKAAPAVRAAPPARPSSPQPSPPPPKPSGTSGQGGR